MVHKEWTLNAYLGIRRELAIVDMVGRQVGKEYKKAVKWKLLDHDGSTISYGYSRSGKEAYATSKAAIESHIAASETGKLNAKRWQQQGLFPDDKLE